MLNFLGHLPLVALVAMADALNAERAETCGLKYPPRTQVAQHDGYAVAMTISGNESWVASAETVELATAALVAMFQTEAEERRVRLATTLSMNEWEMRENPPPCQHRASGEEVAEWQQEYMDVHRALHDALQDARRASFN